MMMNFRPNSSGSLEGVVVHQLSEVDLHPAIPKVVHVVPLSSAATEWPKSLPKPSMEISKVPHVEDVEPDERPLG